jgi:hypothetical protein
MIRKILIATVFILTAIIGYFLYTQGQRQNPVPMPVPLEKKIDITAPTASGTVRGVQEND